MSFFLPDQAINQHIAILGKTGSGKTYCAKAIVEHLLHQRRQVCVIDPTAAWYGLRLSADGKAAGYDVVLLGGKHADVPLAERSGVAVARLVTGQGASVVIDTTGFTVGEYTRWFIDFAGTLYTTIRSPLHLVIDEAHYFMPQGKAPDPQAGKMIHAGNRLMSGGRSLGIRGMLITQRPAKLHKDSLTCADTLIAMRVIAPQDRSAIKDWIDGAGNPAQGKEVLDSLAGLNRGEGWVWYPEDGYLKRTAFPKIRTYDSSATPTHGAKSGPKVGEIKLDEVKAALAEAVKEAEANDPKLLRAEISRLKAAKPATADPNAIERAHAAGKAEAAKEAAAAIKERDRIIGTLTGKLGRGHKAASDLAALLHVNGEATPQAPLTIELQPIKQRVDSRPAVRSISTRSSVTADASLSGRSGLRRILVALAQRNGLSARQVGVRAMLSSKSGTFDTYISKARTNGWIEGTASSLTITDAGLAALGSYDPLPQGPELLTYWLNELGTSGAARMLRALADAYPNALTKEQLGEASGLALSGTFDTYLSKLRTLELVDGRGQIRASEELF